jgi:N4-gp56 family major capsid protein
VATDYPSTSFNIGLNTTDIQYFQKKAWKAMRVASLADQLAGAGAGAAITRITELTNTEWGYQAILTLVPDDTTFGVVGDNRLKDNERGLTSYDQNVTFDQFRKAFKTEGQMADRSSWIRFAGQAADQLSFWGRDIKDRLLINTLSGISYDTEVNGAARVSQFPQCRFAADVSAPSANRYFIINDSGTLESGKATGDVSSKSVPSWNTFIDMRTELPLMRIKPLRGQWGNGRDLYICLVHPRTMGLIKKDTTFQQNWRDALSRGEGNVLFRGAESYMVDGILIISHRYVYNTLGAASGSKWGSGGTVDGTRSLFLGAQAIGMVEMGGPVWVPDEDDYKNNHSISQRIRFGFKKAVWPDQWMGDSDEDFGVVAVDHYLPTGATTYS